MLNAGLLLLALAVLAILLYVRVARMQAAINSLVDYERLKTAVDAVDKELKHRSCTDLTAADHLLKARLCLEECEKVVNMSAGVMLNPISLHRQYVKLGEQASAGLQHLQQALDISAKNNKSS